jgi:EAL domain-containing protein (putative c-di-GMP-specific phosphodiesterase class I)
MSAALAAPTDELDLILSEGLLRSVYQPIVEIDSGRVVGYEALARGPEGSPLERPDLLFAAARDAGRLVELEWAARAAAISGALEAGLRQTLFLNVEPSLLAAPAPEHLAPLIDRATDELDVVLELTERALADHPAALLSRVDAMRGRGCAIALDDVGVDRRSLALMPFVRPEVIKLDMRIVQDTPGPGTADIVHAVNAHAERTGAVVLAEGIETEEHREIARALGARYGQGWLFGRPGPLPDADGAERGLEAPRSPLLAPETTAFVAVSRRRATRRGTKRLLLAISRQLEEHVLRQADAAVVIAAFQDARHFTPATSAYYERMAKRAAFVGALGADLPERPAPGVRGVTLTEAEALRGEWDVVVLAPHFAGAIVARDLGDTGPDMERRFDFCLTYDRDLVVDAARALMLRVAAR